MLRGHGVWTIELVDGASCVGTCGIVHTEGCPRPELTWWIARDARRRGIAVEASHAVISWTFADGWTTVETHMKDANTPARRLTEKRKGKRIARDRFPDGIERDVFEFPRPR
jgi:RimJ/RimL family protein N-acetyltransferase